MADIPFFYYSGSWHEPDAVYATLIGQDYDKIREIVTEVVREEIAELLTQMKKNDDEEKRE